MVSQSGSGFLLVKIKFKYLLVNLLTTSFSQECYLGQALAVGKSQFPVIVSSVDEKVIFQSSASCMGDM